MLFDTALCRTQLTSPSCLRTVITCHCVLGLNVLFARPLRRRQREQPSGGECPGSVWPAAAAEPARIPAALLRGGGRRRGAAARSGRGGRSGGVKPCRGFAGGVCGAVVRQLRQHRHAGRAQAGEWRRRACFALHRVDPSHNNDHARSRPGFGVPASHPPVSYIIDVFGSFPPSFAASDAGVLPILALQTALAMCRMLAIPSPCILHHLNVLVHHRANLHEKLTFRNCRTADRTGAVPPC